MDIRGKTAIVTGASAGIGLATARMFAQNGAKVILAARSVVAIKQVAGELKQKGYEASAIPVDMRDRAQVHELVDQTVRQYGSIDVLVNNAGQAMAGRIADLDLNDLQQIFSLNVLGVLYAMQAVIPVMRGQGGGMILNISSMVSKMSIPGLSGYASTKAALNILSQTARGELAPENICVITIFPRMTATDFGKNSLGNRGMRQQQRRPPQDVPVDTPEFVAERILAAVRDEPAEQYME